MKLTKVEKVIAQLEVEKAEVQKRAAGDLSVLDMAIRKSRAAQGVVPKRVRLAKVMTATVQVVKPVKKSLHEDRDTRSEEV